MEKDEKQNIKIKLATCLRAILKERKQVGLRNKSVGIEDLALVETMRQLEAASGLSYTIIQTTSVGKRDIQFTTLINLLDSLRISFADFANSYDRITDKDIKKTLEEIQATKKGKIKKKKKRNSKL